MPVAQLGSRPRLCTRFIPGSEGAPASPLVLISTSPHIPPAEGLPPSSVSSSTDWTLGTCLPCPRLPLPATSASPSLTPGQLWARDQPPGRLRSLMQLEGCCRGFAGQRSLQGLRDSQASHPAATPDHHGGAGEWRPHRPRPGPREEVGRAEAHPGDWEWAWYPTQLWGGRPGSSKGAPPPRNSLHCSRKNFLLQNFTSKRWAGSQPVGSDTLPLMQTDGGMPLRALTIRIKSLLPVEQPCSRGLQEAGCLNRAPRAGGGARARSRSQGRGELKGLDSVPFAHPGPCGRGRARWSPASVSGLLEGKRYGGWGWGEGWEYMGLGQLPPASP